MNLSSYKKVMQHSVKRMSVLTALLAASALATQAQVVFSPPKNISNSTGRANGQKIAVDANDNIDVVWVDDNGFSGSTSDVFFSRSTDGGATFSTPLDVSNHPGSRIFSPEIAVGPGGNVYIIWADNSLGQFAEFFSRSSDGGSTFSTPQAVQWSQMAVDSSGNLDVVGINNSPGYNAVFFSRSTDGGASFSIPVQVSNNAGGASLPSLGVDSQGNIYIVWSGSTVIPGGTTNDVFFSGSVNGGTTFSPPTNVSNYFNIIGETSIQVAADSMNNINVVWGAFRLANGTTNFSYRRSSDSGATFSTGYDSSFGDTFPTEPQMALDSLGDANIVWLANADSSFSGVLYERMVGGTRAVGGSVANVLGLPNPQVAVDLANNIDIVFAGGILTGGVFVNDVWFIRSNDLGESFSPLQEVANSNSTNNALIATGRDGRVYLVWQQTTSSGNTDIFFSRSVALASVTLSPAEVTGGSSPTGTVTLSGPAPTGGAVVSLSSSDPAVSVPATVTIPEGTTSATFSATASPLATATTATVSAVFNGVTQTATITVEPPVLTSVTLNPSSTMGGSSSTGTVTLSGPAPAGGSVVALSSSNTSIATVPSSVTVAPGLTSVTFTVSTSRQLCANSATISASFSGVTQTSNLAVMPFVNLPARACGAIGAHHTTTVGNP
ncbi:MAG: hypothetical protein DMG37_15985 [Acidobacteria bacterium]|nr:MAG: hypothetical protein DMG37_15985 [Acidobacteriota bacterium]